jgi:two-component system, NarL family, response regulator NreC
MTLRIVLADDHAMIRDCLKVYLDSAGYTVVGEADNGADAVRHVQSLRPQLVLLDFAMPVLNGIDAARQVLHHAPGTKVVLMTAYSEDQYVIEALRAGIVGYVLKKRTACDLLEAIREVEKGNVYLSPGISRAVVHQMLNQTSPSGVLTMRERQVLQLIAEGSTSKEIGVKLGISTKTAESHRNRLMAKLDIHETAGLVRHALRLGLIQV